MFDGEVGESFGLANGAFVKRLERFAFYFVAALHLADEEFGITANAETRNIRRGAIIQSGDEREIFRDVIGGASEIFSKLVDDRAIGPVNNYGVRSGAGIATGCAVNFSGENIGRFFRFGEQA